MPDPDQQTATDLTPPIQWEWEERPPTPRDGWPCDRRDAHGPHPRRPVGWVDRPIAGQPFQTKRTPIYRLVDGLVTTDETCPGVGAHPATMIGRAG